MKKRPLIPYSRYLRKVRQPVVLHFQPRFVKPVRTPAELKLWQKTVAEQVGIDVRPPVLGAKSDVIVWTFCGGDDADPDHGVYGDDCAQEGHEGD